MSDALNIAQSLLTSSDMTSSIVENNMMTLLCKDMTEADFYFQHTIQEFWLLEDGAVKDGSYHEDKGVGVRLVCDEKTGFAYADDMTLDALKRSVDVVSCMSRQGQCGVQPLASSQNGSGSVKYTLTNPLHDLNTPDKIHLLERVDQAARSADVRVTQVNASLSIVYEVILLLTQELRWMADVRPLIRLNVSVIAEQSGRRERGHAGGGGRYSLTELAQGSSPEGFGQEAARQALVNLDAIAAPAGHMPVVLGSGWPGILLHEAVGHGLEADFNRKKTSVFSDRIGEQVAALGVTVIDNGTLPNRRGSLNMDDEGTPTQENILIENGILKGYMCDKQNGRLLGGVSTGNGRRESYAHLPMPRMTNTYMTAGEADRDEMIRSVHKGIYAVNFGGGQVDITSGQFVFSASEAYLIEDGQITAPIKGATLIGSGPEVMMQVSMVGHDLELDPGVGVCGKDGQSVPVGVGQPTIKVDTLTVGGTEVISS